MKKQHVELLRRARLALMPCDEPVPSPCISVCRMSAKTGFCEGCWRSIDEICAWSGSPDESKQGVWRLLLQRAGLPQPQERR